MSLPTSPRPIEASGNHPGVTPTKALQFLQMAAVRLCGKWAAAGMASRLFARADRVRDSRDYHRAITLYRRGLEMTPSAWRYRVQLGHALKEIGQSREAEAQYLDALQAAPTDGDLHLQLGHLYRMLRYDTLTAIYYARAGHLGVSDVHAIEFLNDTYAKYPDVGWRYPPSSCDNPDLREALAPLLATDEMRNRLRADTAPTGTLEQLIVRYARP